MAVCVGFSQYAIDPSLGLVLQTIPAQDKAVLTLDAVTSIQDCQYILVNTSELTTLTGLSALLSEYFEFDPSTAEFLSVSYLLSWVLGHATGRIVSHMRRV